MIDENGNTIPDEYAEGAYNAPLGEDMPLDDYTPPEVVRDKNPHELTVIKVEVKSVESKGVRKEIVEVLFKLGEDAGLVIPKLVRYSLWLPSGADTAEQQNTAKGKIIKFQTAVGMEVAKTLQEFKQRVVGEATGAKVTAVLKLRHDETYGDSNEIQNILV